MAEEPFLLVSLDEDKSKKLAQVLSNDTARKILEMLSRTENATETQVAKELDVPLSTVHYNLQQLLAADLVSDEHFTYSEKGKQIIHYSLASKYVIIAQKKSDKLLQRLREFLPVVFVSVAASILIKAFWKAPVQETLKIARVDADAMLMSESFAAAAPTVGGQQELALWFLAGSVFTLLIYFIWSSFVLKRE